MVIIKTKSDKSDKIALEAIYENRKVGEVLASISGNILKVDKAEALNLNHHETDSQIKLGLVLHCLNHAFTHCKIEAIEASGIQAEINYPEQLFVVFDAIGIRTKANLSSSFASRFVDQSFKNDAEFLLCKHGEIIETGGKAFRIIEGNFETRSTHLTTNSLSNGMELFIPRERFKVGDVFRRASLNAISNGMLIEVDSNSETSEKPLIAPFGVSAYHGYILSYALVSLHDIGWFNYVANNLSQQYFIEKDLHVLKCNNILRHLYNIIEEAGIISYSVDKNSYTINEEAYKVLEAEIGYVKFIVHGYNMVLNETKALATGEKQYWKDIKRDDNGVGEFLLTYHHNVEPAIFNTVKEVGFKKLAYLGCGNATRLIDICKANPNSKAIGVEIDPKVAAKARANIKAAGLSDKIEIIEEDLMTWASRPQPDVDMVLFIMGMAHDFLKDKRRAHSVFFEMKNNLAPNARMILEDINIQEQSDPWSGMTINRGFELVHALMGVNLGTRDTYVKLFEHYGWEVEFVRGTGLANAWIYCIKSDIDVAGQIKKLVTQEEAMTL